jgi:hypothetical protein
MRMALWIGSALRRVEAEIFPAGLAWRSGTHRPVALRYAVLPSSYTCRL